MVVVKVRQGTLAAGGHGSGPARNTGRGWSWLRSGREDCAWVLVVGRGGSWSVVGGRGRSWVVVVGRGWSWLRSGRDHGGSRVAGRQRRRGGEEEEQEEETTDIKSNNPHLADGEKMQCFYIFSDRPTSYKFTLFLPQF